MNYLAIDIGNTLQKASVFSNDGKTLFFCDKEHLHTDDLISIIEQYSVTHSILSSVGETGEELIKTLSSRTRLVVFNHLTALPIRLKYETPETLGLDRIANAVAANALFPQKNVLAIQAGTCLVTDFITKEGEYLGGSISPGIDMRFAALHQFTKRLPLVKGHSIGPYIGRNTEMSIRSGVIYGLTDEINGFIRRYKEQFGDLQVVLTGGNKNDLENSIKSPIFAAPNLVLYGLFKILTFNVEQNI